MIELVANQGYQMSGSELAKAKLVAAEKMRQKQAEGMFIIAASAHSTSIKLVFVSRQHQVVKHA